MPATTFTSNGINMLGSPNVISAPKPSYTSGQVSDYLGGTGGQGISYWTGLRDVGGAFNQALGRSMGVNDQNYYGNMISGGSDINSIINNIRNSPEAQQFAQTGVSTMQPSTQVGSQRAAQARAALGLPPIGGQPTAPAAQPMNPLRQQRMQGMDPMQRDAFHAQKQQSRDWMKALRDMRGFPPELLQGMFGGGQGGMMNIQPYQPPTSRNMMGPGNLAPQFRQMPSMPGQQMQPRVGTPGMMPLPQNLGQYQPALMGNSMFAPRGQYQLPAPASTNTAPATPAGTAGQPAYGTPEWWVMQQEEMRGAQP